MLLRVPVGMAMGLVGVAGFGVIPMFLLMGAFVSNFGVSR
jgi:hypothetical protein